MKMRKIAAVLLAVLLVLGSMPVYAADGGWILPASGETHTNPFLQTEETVEAEPEEAPVEAEAEPEEALETGEEIAPEAQEPSEDPGADPDATIVDSGNCGAEGNESSVKWSLDSTGTLTIYGKGEMADYFTRMTPWEKKEVKKVVIQHGVTSIGSTAFSECTSLVSVTISDDVASISHHAFSDCTSLPSVTIPDSVTSIEAGAFEGCKVLTSVTIPKTLSFLGGAWFTNTPWQKAKGDFPVVNGVLLQYQGSDANVTIPESIIYIGDNAFKGCSFLENVTIPDSVTFIGNGAFDFCTSLTNVTIPDSVTSIRSYAFSNCTSLTSVTMPNSVTSIGERVFYACASLSNITIPKSVTKILRQAFGYDESNNPISGFIISGYTGTAAETYAKENGFKFVPLKVVLQTPKAPTLKNTTAGIQITWKKQADASVYRIYYKLGANGAWKKLTKDQTGDSYTWTGAKAGNKYYFRLKAVDSDGNESAYCAPEVITRLKTPAGATLTNTSAGVKITWSKVSGAVKYRVYGKEGADGKWKKLTSDKTGTSYTWTKASAGKKYYFRIVAVAKDESTSQSGTIKATVRLKTPAGPTLSNTTKGIKITWSKQSGATKYRIYYKLGADGKWSKLTKDQTGTTYTWTKAAAGKKYYFRIVAVSKEGYVSQNGTIKAITRTKK